MNKLLFNFMLIALLLAFVSCGGGGDSSETANQESGSESVETMDDGVRTITIHGTDDMKFVVEEEGEGLVTGNQVGQNYILTSIEAAPGEEIRITLSTISNLPATAMSHNFILLNADTDLTTFTTAALKARDNDYIPADLSNQIIVHTELLANGESDTITFTAPEEPGEYEFICSFPGHFSGGMRGTLIVQ